MSNLSRYYLQQMGITLWRCDKPTHYPEHFCQQEKKELPQQCKLLIISNDNFNGHPHFLSQILKALQLDINQCLVITEAESEFYYQEPDWLWVLGSNSSLTISSSRLLLSPMLDELMHSPKAKRALWQQMITCFNQVKVN